MSDEPIGESYFRNWKAKSWVELSAIWEDIKPDLDLDFSLFRAVPPTAQQRGWVFERLVMEAFRLSGAQIDHHHANPIGGGASTLEEIDGLVYRGWQGFLVESKYQKRKVTIDPIFRLHLMAEQRPVGTMGLFFSATGHTNPTLEMVERLRPIRVLLFDKIDLDWAIGPGEDMIEMVRRKWVLSLRSGRPHMNVTEFAGPFGGS